MKIIKLFGYAGVAGAVIALLASTTVVTETAQAGSATADKSGNLVHRVSYALASDTEYTASVPSGYKWGNKSQAIKSEATWAGSKEPRSGYKWGNARANVNADQSVSSYATQTANPWGRRDFSEQAANPWGRRDFSEQAANPWGRRDFSEQAANPWGRRDFSEQAANPWGRR